MVAEGEWRVFISSPQSESAKIVPGLVREALSSTALSVKRQRNESFPMISYHSLDLLDGIYDGCLSDAKLDQ